MSKKIINNKKSEKLALVIAEAMEAKQGEKILSIDLSHLDNLIAKYFVICHANSGTQVNAIADYIEESVKKTLKEKVWHGEGHQNAQWILLDYADVVVHIFQTQYRDYYNLEELWADGKFSYHNEEDQIVANKVKAKVKNKTDKKLPAKSTAKKAKVTKPKVKITVAKKTLVAKADTKIKTKTVVKAKAIKVEKADTSKIKKAVKPAEKVKATKGSAISKPKVKKTK